MEEDDSDGYNTDHEALTSKKRINALKPRGAKTTAITRRNALEKDEHSKNVSAHEVTCATCNQKIKLHSTRTYDTTHWDQHKAICP
jgi:hypothetical protein